MNFTGMMKGQGITDFKIKFYFTRAKLSQYMYTITPRGGGGDLEISSLKGYSYLLSTSQRSNFQRF